MAGGGLSNFNSQQQTPMGSQSTPAASNPLGPQQGQGTPAFGGQQQPMQQQPFGSGQGQMPNFATPNQLFGLSGSGSSGGGQQQRPNPFSQLRPPANYQQPKLPDWVQAPDPNMPSTNAVVKLTNPDTGETFMAPGGGYSVRQQQPQPPQQSMSFDQWKQQPRVQTQEYRSPEQQLQKDQQDYQKYLSSTGGMQSPPPMQNPFQPQQPSFMQNPEYQGYQTQLGDLQRQMNEYMQKAPMYQQMRDLESKMAPFQQRHQQQQMQQRQFQQPSPFRRGQFQQPAGLQGLMGMLGGRGRTVMPQAQPRMSMDMPQTYGHMEALPQNFMKNGGKV